MSLSDPPRNYASLSLALLFGSAFLAATAAGLAFYSSGTDADGVAVYPFLSPPLAGLISEIVTLSALMFGFATVLRWKDWLPIVLVAGILLCSVGVGTFLYALAHPFLVQSGGGPIQILPFSQAIYPLIWGLTVLVFTPVDWFVKRVILKAARDHPHPTPRPR